MLCAMYESPTHGQPGTWLLIKMTPKGVVFSFLFYVGPTTAETS